MITFLIVDTAVMSLEMLCFSKFWTALQTVCQMMMEL